MKRFLGLFALAMIVGIFFASGLAWAHGEGDDISLQCDNPVGETVRVTINGGRAYADPGEVFGFDVEELKFNLCQKVEVTFVNHDDVRHALMVDSISPAFILELPGQGEKTASFVTPSVDESLVLHSHVPGQDRAGMKGLITVGQGDNSLSSGNSEQNAWTNTTWVALALFGGFILGGVGVWTKESLK